MSVQYSTSNSILFYVFCLLPHFPGNGSIVTTGSISPNRNGICESNSLLRASLWRVFFLSKFNLSVAFTYDLHFFLFNIPFIQHWHSFLNVLFNPDSRFLSSAFVFFKHNVRSKLDIRFIQA